MQPSARERSLRLRDESLELSYSSEELNTRLISYENDELDYDLALKRPIVYITDDTEVVVNDTRVHLSPTRVFVLNALRLSQGFAQTADEIIDLGYKGAPANLKHETLQLLRLLNEVANETLIESARQGYKGSNIYTLVPTVEFIDKRVGNPEEQKAVFLQNCVMREKDGSIPRQENGSLSFHSQLKREEATRLMLQDFREQAKVDSALLQIFEGRMGRTKPDMPILRLFRFLPELTKEQEAELLKRKEDALELYLSGKIDFPEAERQTIVDGVRASYKLFAYNLQTVGALARRLSTAQLPFSELYQEGAMQLMEAVLRQQYYSDASQNFKYIAGWYIRTHRGRGMNKLYFRHLLPPVSLHSNFSTEWYALKEVRENLEEEYGKYPSTEELSDRSGLSPDKVRGILNVGSPVLYLDKPILDAENRLVYLDLPEPDFVDEHLDHMEQQRAIDTIFYSSALTDVEKVIISIQFRIFHPALKGLQINGKNQTVFTYPQDEMGLYQLVQEQRTVTHFGVAELGRSINYGGSVLDKALRHARQILTELPNFDSSQYTDKKTAEQNDQEKTDIVVWAKEISPKQRLGSKELRALGRSTGSSYSEQRIIELFGSLPKFHIECGFEADRRRTVRNMQPADIVELACAIRPNEALTTHEVKILSKHREFVSMQAIYNNFGSLPNFQQACRKEMERRANLR